MPLPHALATTASAALLLGSALGASAQAVDSAQAQANKIVNGGFETPSVGEKMFLHGPAGAGWIFSGLTGITGNDSAFTVRNPPAPQGTQVAFLQQRSSFSQTLTALPAGYYSFRFRAAQRGGGNDNEFRYGYSSDIQNFRIVVDGVVLDTFTPVDTKYDQYQTRPRFLSAGKHILTFVGINTAYLSDSRRKENPDAGDNTAFIDNIGYDYSRSPKRTR